jgi:hypothetical protein
VDPCSFDDFVVPDYTARFVETVVLLGIDVNFQTVV